VTTGPVSGVVERAPSLVRAAGAAPLMALPSSRTEDPGRERLRRLSRED
jgi:hypothetical protein